MDEETTTDSSVDENPGGQEPQPGATDEKSAEDTNTDANAQDNSDNSDDSQSASTDEGSQQEPETSDEDVTKWLEGKGINPSDASEDTLKVAKMAVNSEKRMHEVTSSNGGAAKEALDDAVNDAEAAGQMTGDEAWRTKMELKLSVMDFYTRNPDALQYDKQIGELIRKEPYLANNFKRAYQIARLEGSGESIDKATENARKSERELLNQKQRAGAARPAASSKTEDKEEIDPIMAGLKSND